MDARAIEILEQFAQEVVPELQTQARSFGPSIRYGIGGNALVIDGHPHIGVLMYGRGPTTSGASKGDPTLYENILSWINRHGITPKNDDPERPMTSETLAFMISRSIHRHGTRLYQEIKRGGQPKDIFGVVLTEDRISNLLKTIADDMQTRITSDLLTNLTAL